MSWQLRVLNRHLRWFEKPALAKYAPDRLRRSFEFKARLYFHPPRGTQFTTDELAGVPVQWAAAPGSDRTCVLLYFHGGAYVFGSSNTHRALAAKLSQLTGMQACVPDYRLAPEHPFPAQIEDALACYLALSQSHDVILGGDSAGGGLALGLTHCLLKKGLPLPRGVFALSPVVDMTYSGASVTENAQADCVLSPSRIEEVLGMFLRGQDPKDPRASPLFGDFKGAPPVWLTAGDTEFLRDDSIRMARKLEDEGVSVDLSIKPDHPHVWPLFHNILPEGRSTLRDIANWIAALPK